MERKNINRGFKKLRVWPPARRAYAPEGKMLFSFTSWPVKYLPTSLLNLKKVAANSIDAAHSISRNISEGCCRGVKGVKSRLLTYLIRLVGTNPSGIGYAIESAELIVKDNKYQLIDSFTLC